MTKNKIIITCPKRISDILRLEVEDLGYEIKLQTDTYVEISGDIKDVMRLNLNLRTGYHVLYFIDEFYAENPEDLYKNMKKIQWEKFFTKNTYISINSKVDNPFVNDSRFPNLKAKDAVVDRLREKWGERPDTGAKSDGGVIFFYWINNKCTVFLDTSGVPLSKRNYRKMPYKAPMQEALGAAVILTSMWNGKSNFINPMCGSGTIAIEAALIAKNFAPGLLRENFAFKHLKLFDEKSWNEIKKEAESKIILKPDIKIIASDISVEAIKAARINAKAAKVNDIIEFQICDFEKTDIPDGIGTIVMNPEYGERMGNEHKLEKLYSQIGDFLKNKCKGYWGYIFTGNLKLSKKIGLRSNRRIPFYNSTIDCRLIEFELYDGSRKFRPTE